MLDRLKELTQSMSPGNMVMGMLEGYLPQIKTFADGLNQPEAAGGILKEGEGMATLMVDFSAEQPQILIATLADQEGATVIRRTIDIKDLMAKKQAHGERGED